jgi:hypothetical protein
VSYVQGEWVYLPLVNFFGGHFGFKKRIYQKDVESTY